jgi:hypothetical protein
MVGHGVSGWFFVVAREGETVLSFLAHYNCVVRGGLDAAAIGIRVWSRAALEWRAIVVNQARGSSGKPPQTASGPRMRVPGSLPGVRRKFSSSWMNAVTILAMLVIEQDERRRDLAMVVIDFDERSSRSGDGRHRDR